jgi:hypothetical protein
VHVDSAQDTGDERRIVVMNAGGGEAYIAIGVPVPANPDDHPKLGPRYTWTVANALDRHDMMLLAALCEEVALELPWVDVDEDGKHHVATVKTSRFSGDQDG